MNTETDTEWLSGPVVAKMLNISPHTLLRWRLNTVRQGPPYHKFGTVVRYNRKDIEEWVTAGRVEAAS